MRWIINNAHGRYIPQIFCQQEDAQAWAGVSQEDWDTCLAGPDEEHYDEAWADILDHATYQGTEAERQRARFTGRALATYGWRLLQEDGDVFMVSAEETSDDG